MQYLLTAQETERLRFRLLQEQDFDTWLELFRNADAVRFLGMGEVGTPEQCCQWWFAKAEERYTDNTGGMNVLIDKQSGELVGQCGLLVQEVDEIQELEIGYSMHPRHWGKGYATEAARKCRDEAFTRGYADHLISIIHPENIASSKVAQHNGMTLWKTTLYKGMQVNVYRILKSDWEKLR